MSRKDYRNMAYRIYALDLPSQVERALYREILETITEFFQEDNPNFDPDRFKEVCDNG